MTQKIESLTPFQEALIPAIREKWRAIAFSTQPIDRQKAAEAVKAVYALYWEQEPEILFFDSLYATLKDINIYLPDWEACDRLDLLGTLESPLYDQLSDSLHSQLHDQLLDPLCELLHERWDPLLQQFYRQLEILRKVVDNFAHDVNPQYWLVQCSFIDFCVFVLNCSVNPSERNAWEALQMLVNNCGWMYHFAAIETDKVTCVVCDRPKQPPTPG